MQLHYAPGTIAVAVAIALHEAGIDFDPVHVDFAQGEQTKPTYRALNPKGRVPVLIDDGHVLTETGAILDYIAARAPAAGLVPDDPLDAHHVRATMYYLASTMHVNHAHRMRGSRWATRQDSFDDMASMVARNMTESAAYVEADILRGTYVLGDRISVADAYLFAVCAWLEGDGVDTAVFPRITAFMAAMAARGSVHATKEQGILP